VLQLQQNQQMQHKGVHMQKERHTCALPAAGASTALTHHQQQQQQQQQ
jgi:hypothetical protein